MTSQNSRRSRLVAAGALLVALVCAAAPAAAQYQIDQWTIDEGLPQNSVLALLQARDGYLWLATSDGLARFGGVQFTTFNRATTKGLTTNRFTALLETSAGDIWIGTEDGGAVRYRGGHFETFSVDAGLPRPWVWGMSTDGDGRVIAFTPRGAAVFDGARFRPVGPAGQQPGISRWAPGTVFEAGGLARFDGRETIRWAYPAGVARSDVSSVVEDNRGQLYLVTGGGAYFRAGSAGWTSVPSAPRASLAPRVLHTDARGRLWVPTDSGVVVVADDGTEEIAMPLTPTGDGVSSMLEDREGNIWLGSVRSGLFRIRRRVVTVIGRDEGLLVDNIYPLTEDAAGRVWIGTWGAGLYRLSADGIRRWAETEGLPSPHITALYAENDGVIVGVQNHGVCFIGPDDRIQWRVADALPGRVVSAIIRDAAGTLWLGTNQGLVSIDGTTVTSAITKAAGLPDLRVRVLETDRAGRLWIGTISGLAMMSGGKISVPAGAEALRGDHVRAIHVDDDGTVWIGTADTGLVRLRDGKVTRYTQVTGLASHGVFAILDDGAGHFWMSSNRGLARVSRRELVDHAEGRSAWVTSRSFTRADGLRTLEANGGRQPAGFRGRDGRLWFATSVGAAIVDPSRIAELTPPPAPVVEKVSIGGEVVDRPGRIEVEPGRPFISVDYGVGVLIAPETVRFRVRLVGLDDAWSDVGGQRSMTYSRLRPGIYGFEVAAVQGGQVGPTTTLAIAVHPRFYETMIFNVLALVAAGGSLTWVVSRRTAATRRRQRREREFARQLLESQDRERQRLASEVHDGLGQQLLVIRNQALLGRETPADAAGCFEVIADAAAQSLDEVRAIAAALHPTTLERLGLTRALAAMVRALSRATPVSISIESRVDRRLPAAVELQLYRIVQECLTNALRHAAATTITVSVALDDHLVEVAVVDDGRGFDPSRVAGGAERGIGLSSMRERARHIGADLTIDSQPGRGTTVRVRLALPDGDHEDAPA